MTSRLPINLMAPLLIAIPVLLLGIWLSTMWHGQSREAVSDLADQKISQIHDLVTLKIADVVAVPPRVCRINEHLVRTGALVPGNLDAWRPTLFEELAAFDMLSAITWGSEDGRSAWIARYADGETYWGLKNDPALPTMYEWIVDASGDIPESPTNAFEFDLFSRPWYVTPREAGAPAWSPPYVWAGAEDSKIATVGISYGRPIYEPDGRLLGIMDTDISLNDLSGFLQSMAIGKTGVAILTSSNGHLLATSNKSRVVSADGSLSQVASSQDPMIARIGQALDQQVQPENFNATIDLNGQPHYMRISTAGTDVGLDWRLATIVPEADFLSNIETHFRRSLILSIAAVILVVIIATAAARWLLDPLLKLIAALNRIGQGELDTRVHLGTTAEYVKLGDAINNMTASLQKSREQENMLQRELDHRVKNMLSQIVALCQQTATRSTTDRHLIDDLASRVASLSGVHELLNDRGQVGLPLEELVRECCEPYLPSPDHMDMSGPEFFVCPKAAMCLSLLTNELATNSCKYGSLTRDEGHVEVRWRVVDENEENPCVLWQWIETRGVPPSGEIVPGFGTKMLKEMIPYELSGTAELSFTSDGLQFSATIPIEHFTGAA